jgi:hypothetical protein
MFEEAQRLLIKMALLVELWVNLQLKLVHCIGIKIMEDDRKRVRKLLVSKKSREG